MSDQLYIAMKRERSSDKAPLGFASRYNPESIKCNERNRKQDDWADYKLDADGNFIEEVNHRWEWSDGETFKWDSPKRSAEFYDYRGCPIHTRECDIIPLPDYLKPRVIDNTWRTDFQIVDTVSRMSTSNKLWRILDPFGFELEISTANMEQIIYGGMIDRGVIIGNCKWDFGKTGIGKATLNRLSA